MVPVMECYKSFSREGMINSGKKLFYFQKDGSAFDHLMNRSRCTFINLLPVKAQEFLFPIKRAAAKREVSGPLLPQSPERAPAAKPIRLRSAVPVSREC